MFDETTVDTENGSLVTLPELSARLSIGDRGEVREMQLSAIQLEC